MATPERTGGNSPLRAAVAFGVVTIALLLVFTLFTATDYVGIDNDDAMRLVEVRDLINGQGWFDTTQYRLGLAEGTVMHWSRLIDLPIAALIGFFRIFASDHLAEVMALAIWPLILTLPVLYAIAFGCFRLGGRSGMYAGLVLAAIMLVSGVRFRPGAIDHHNVQIALIATMAAMFLDRSRRAGPAAVAGAATALAIAIGVETTPLVAAGAVGFAVLWAFEGENMRKAAAGYGLALALVLAAAFVLTVPGSLYSTVTCDNLSIGFLVPAMAGGLGLSLAAGLLSARDRTIRFASLLVLGAVTGVAMLLIAPQCLGNPLDSLDPLLQTLWLSGVSEAQSAFAMMRDRPAELAGNYVPGLLALVVCLVNLYFRRAPGAYFMLCVLLSAALAVAFFQVRGAVFSNLLSIFPLSVAIADLRMRARAEPGNLKAGLGFAAMTLAAIPGVWFIAGLALPAGGAPLMETASLTARCDTQDALGGLAEEPETVVAAASNLGAAILRFTPHRVLSAPYHRNQAGMLAELEAGLAEPDAARAVLQKAGVGLLAYCADDPQIRKIAEKAPDGLYARIGRGEVPAWLVEIPADRQTSVTIYRMSEPPSR